MEKENKGKGKRVRASATWKSSPTSVRAKL
jgi:hypothetical protein